MVDIHSHILPGLDDGPKTLDESVEMLRQAAEAGTTDIVATPHANNEYVFDPELIAAKIAEIQSAAGPIPRIHCGCDFHLTLENIQEALSNPGKYSINHLGYLLIEFSEALIPKTTQEIFDRFLRAGLTPIITHPERNFLLQKKIDQIYQWVEKGALVQVTAGSITGMFGRAAKSAAGQLIDRNLVHLVASDAHDTHHRTTKLRDAYDAVEKAWGAERAELFFVSAPRSVIAGKEIPWTEPEPGPEKRKWYRLGF